MKIQLKLTQWLNNGDQMKPKLQLALDLNNLNEALSIAEQAIDKVDIIEIGTVLAIESGLDSVRKMREKLPQAKILADIRIIKAGGKLANMAYEAGADIVTIISDSTEETFEAVVEEKEKADNREVLIEINEGYTDKQLQKWKNKYDLNHLIFHRGSEIINSSEPWNKKDFDEIKRLAEMGFKCYVTGGIGIEEISSFKNVPVECFIVGRTITGAENPEEVANNFQKELEKLGVSNE